MEEAKMESQDCQMQGPRREFFGYAEVGPVPLSLRLKFALARNLSPSSRKMLKTQADKLLGLFPKVRGTNRASIIPQTPATSLGLKAGDMVRVRSREEIEATLDRWGELNGCAFMDDMAQYCDTVQRVFKPVERFMDERDYRMKKVKGLILLEGGICPGHPGLGRCDRSCFYFWREEWLEKI
jgi:hypothetical protein